MATSNSEDYLRCIYKLQEGDEAVATSQIAAALGITAPSVTDMVQRLAQENLVIYKKYGGVRLTPAGRRAALTLTRRHRLWEMFLVSTLGFSWDEVHEIADMLEHVTPDILEDRIDRFLGQPTADPHGDPIPSKTGALPRLAGVRLVECNAGCSATVVRVTDDRAEALQMLAKNNIRLERKLHVVEVAAYDGSMQLRVGSKDVFLSKELAATVFVRIDKR